MDTENQNISLSLLLASLEDDFDNEERLRIFELLKNSNPIDDALVGAKMLLEENNWDYKILKKLFFLTENKVEGLAFKTKKIKNINYFKYAAVLIPITFIFGFLINQNIFYKTSIEQFYFKEEGLPNYMGIEKNEWNDLMELYRANKFKEAFKISEQLIIYKPQNDTATYFHGIISYELRNYKLAKSEFTKISQNKKSVFYYDASFRLGFALKNLQKVNDSKSQFEKVSKDYENPFNEKAKIVLKEFKE